MQDMIDDMERKVTLEFLTKIRGLEMEMVEILGRHTAELKLEVEMTEILSRQTLELKRKIADMEENTKRVRWSDDEEMVPFGKRKRAREGVIVAAENREQKSEEIVIQEGVITPFPLIPPYLPPLIEQPPPRYTAPAEDRILQLTEYWLNNIASIPQLYTLIRKGGFEDRYTTAFGAVTASVFLKRRKQNTIDALLEERSIVTDIFRGLPRREIRRTVLSMYSFEEFKSYRDRTPGLRGLYMNPTRFQKNKIRNNLVKKALELEFGSE